MNCLPNPFAQRMLRLSRERWVVVDGAHERTELSLCSVRHPYDQYFRDRLTLAPGETKMINYGNHPAATHLTLRVHYPGSSPYPERAITWSPQGHGGLFPLGEVLTLTASEKHPLGFINLKNTSTYSVDVDVLCVGRQPLAVPIMYLVPTYPRVVLTPEMEYAWSGSKDRIILDLAPYGEMLVTEMVEHPHHFHLHTEHGEWILIIEDPTLRADFLWAYAEVRYPHLPPVISFGMLPTYVLPDEVVVTIPLEAYDPEGAPIMLTWELICYKGYVEGGLLPPLPPAALSEAVNDPCLPVSEVLPPPVDNTWQLNLLYLREGIHTLRVSAEDNRRQVTTQETTFTVLRRPNAPVIVNGSVNVLPLPEEAPAPYVEFTWAELPLPSAPRITGIAPSAAGDYLLINFQR